MRHPWAAQIWMSGPTVSADRFAQSDAVLRCLREAGLPPEAIYSAYHALEGYPLGYAMQRQDFAAYTGKQLRQTATDFLKTFPVDVYPDFAEHVDQHLDPGFTGTDSFEFGLDLILDGLQRLADGAREPSGRRRAVAQPQRSASRRSGAPTATRKSAPTKKKNDWVSPKARTDES